MAHLVRGATGLTAGSVVVLRIVGAGQGARLVVFLLLACYFFILFIKQNNREMPNNLATVMHFFFSANYDLKQNISQFAHVLHTAAFKHC